MTAAGNLALVLANLGRSAEAVSRLRELMMLWVKVEGNDHRSTMTAANNLAITLRDVEEPV
jgi:hypothetical protein